MISKLSLPCTAAMLVLASAGAAAGSDTICLLAQQFSRVDTYLLDDEPLQVELSDLDQDGYTDAVVLFPDANAFEIHTSTPEYAFELHQRITLADEPVALLIHDMDTDGYPDLFIAEKSTGMLSLYINNQDGTLAAGPQFDIGPDTRSMTKADLNNDGLIDLIIPQYPTVDSPAQRVVILMGQAAMQFAAPLTLLSDMPVYDATAADFNNDSIADIAVLEGVTPFASNQGRVYLGNGDGTFQPPLGINHTHSSRQTLATDLNNDGNTDLVSMSRLDLRTYFSLGNGDGTFAPSTSTLVGFSQTRILACDLEQDGDIDIVSAENGSTNPASRSISLLYNNDNNNNFNQQRMPNISASAWIATADINQDGREDFVVTDEFNNALRVLINQCGVCPADLNGDGQLDFFDVSVLLDPAPGANTYLDYNLDGTTNFFDISAFLTDFQSGCN